ncbi:unnamed protein product [Dovyalis caffra]|uniref:4Fe-4S ferredoxin-type domain-containing protein n=1 Tax=Dovyalis caffra TaxID=77055 RepID=A0AAV1QZ46_9ROSI|nr:unnamed protein product [Dovyalis caffra]
MAQSNPESKGEALNANYRYQIGASVLAGKLRPTKHNVILQCVSDRFLESYDGNNNRSTTTTTISQQQSYSSHRKLLVHGTCTNRDLSISQSKDTTSGIPQYIVQIVNTCVFGCAPSNIHLHCGWFASARMVNPRIFKRLSYDDCLVNGGKALKTSQIVRFTYSNSFMYALQFNDRELRSVGIKRAISRWTKMEPHSKAALCRNRKLVCRFRCKYPRSRSTALPEPSEVHQPTLLAKSGEGERHTTRKENYRNNNKCLESVRNLVKTTRIASVVSAPQESLQKGNWVKLICGASFEDVVDIRNLSLVYTLAGGKRNLEAVAVCLRIVDCIDCAADASVVNAVNEGIEAAREIFYLRKPWVMISVNDDEDLHFRKAEFDPVECPLDCSRPCETICPANAISLEQHRATTEFSSGTETLNALKGGVLTERCYGCGRCFPVCPYDKIRMAMYVRNAAATAELLKRNDVDAIEIHTSGRCDSKTDKQNGKQIQVAIQKQTAPFEGLWDDLGNSIRHLKLVAVSLPYVGDSTISLMNAMYAMMEPHLTCLNLWQLDGRPMSGDIGRGATRESIAFAVRLASVKDKPCGFFQLAGGTNAHTVEGLKREGLFQTTLVAKNSKDKKSIPASHALIGGIAYGGYARKIVGRVLSSLQSQHGLARIEDYPEHLLEALAKALDLVGTVKCYDPCPLDY